MFVTIHDSTKQNNIFKTNSALDTVPVFAEIQAFHQLVICLTMNPMKTKTALTRSKVVAADSCPPIHNYFKVTHKEKGCTTSDSKAVYVQALKDRLKSKIFSAGHITF